MNTCQLYEFIDFKIKTDVQNKDNVALIEKVIKDNINAFTFANKSLAKLTLYIVIRHLGDVVIFKTINDKVIKSKLDIEYVKSQELHGLEQWNLNKVYKLTFGERGVINYGTINYKQLISVISSTIEPHNLCYTVKVEDLEFAYNTIRVDKDLVGNIGYPELLRVIRKAYTSALGVDNIDGELDICLVDYLKN